MRKENKTAYLWLIGIGLLFPLFFQLSGSIYHNPEPLLDSGGILATVPLPIAIPTCFLGILLLIGNYRHAFLALALVTSMSFLMLVSLLYAGSDIDIQRPKVILLLQFLLPVFGAVLGQMVDDKDKIIPRAFLCVLLLIVPAQLLSGWM